MRNTRQHTPLWNRFFLLLMAFYIINVSIDAPDGYVIPNQYGELREDLSVNEIESIGEFVLETCFGLQDAIPEYDEPEDEASQNRFTKLYWDWSVPAASVHYLFETREAPLLRSVIPFVTPVYLSQTGEVSTPPPQWVC